MPSSAAAPRVPAVSMPGTVMAPQQQAPPQQGRSFAAFLRNLASKQSTQGKFNFSILSNSFHIVILTVLEVSGIFLYNVHLKYLRFCSAQYTCILEHRNTYAVPSHILNVNSDIVVVRQ